MVNVWFALGWTPPSPITPPDTIPEAVANMNLGIVGGNVPVAPGGDTCPGDDGLLFSWHGENVDVAEGTPAGCATGAGDGTADANSTPALNATHWTKDGTNSIDIPTAADYYYFTWANDTMERAAGTLDFWFYSNSCANSARVWGVDDAGDQGEFYIKVYNNEDECNLWFYACYSGTCQTGAMTAVNPGTGYADSTAYHVRAMWRETDLNPNFKICMDTTDGTTNCGTDDDNPGAWNGDDSGIMYFGDQDGWGGDFKIDLIKIYNDWDH